MEEITIIGTFKFKILKDEKAGDSQKIVSNFLKNIKYQGENKTTCSDVSIDYVLSNDILDIDYKEMRRKEIRGY